MRGLTRRDDTTMATRKTDCIEHGPTRVNNEWKSGTNQEILALPALYVR
jgi:hypothetical protein